MSTHDDWAAQTTADALASADAPRLDGRVALVAGGGLSGPLGGVGFSIAWLCARSGASVAVLDLDQAAGERAVAAIRDAGGEAEWFSVDVTDSASVEAAVEAAVSRFGRLDLVADSIGGGGAVPAFDVDDDEFDRVLNLNFLSAWRILKYSQRHLGEGSAAVTISSSATEGRGPTMPYTIAKTALEKLTIGAASSLAPRGIRVNGVRVGMIWGAFAARGMTEEQRELRRQNVALQTEGTVWDIASAAFFLLTDRARWISGQVIAVDGGGFAMKANTGAAGSAPASKEKR
ncbi:SDR family NAD(P)-dependent oxidoreductase [Microbacterium marinilacus]|uniref:7-alpha-hydroxysteroid dehydrogenase n=1 Tax=Microbacterium marinilacus TaxID=415209 RepID=A0ABP7BMV3_9MICO|nr:SDR family oxidoreductase [Microbacterium marinilacus]MBY0688381.1 SDR family oxidoreductase [Microbacterium marinilacus]